MGRQPQPVGSPVDRVPDDRRRWPGAERRAARGRRRGWSISLLLLRAGLRFGSAGRPLATAPDRVPSDLGGRVDQWAERPRTGNLEFALLDEANLLTGLFRTERSPTTQLTNSANATQTTLLVQSSAGISADSVIWVGDEAFRVTATGVGTIDVERGYLGTRAGTHAENDGVFQSTPILESRRVSLYLAPLDADSASDAREVGSYVIDGFDISEDANVWKFRHTRRRWPSRS